MEPDFKSMTINERVKYIRKDLLDMNQSDFATKLGMKQTGVSTYEQNGKTVTDTTVNIICLVFGINESFIRKGEIPIFNDMPDKKMIILEALRNEKNNPLFDIINDFLEIYYDLDKSDQEFLKSLAATLREKHIH